MGVWIETLDQNGWLLGCIVTPCVGVWIETLVVKEGKGYKMSHPAWVCGLKL